MKKIKTQNKPQKSKKKYFFQKTTKTKKTQNVEIRKTYMYLLFFVYSYMYLWIERKRGQQLWKKISIYIDNEWCIIYKSLGDITKDTIAIELSEPWRVKNKRLEKELLQSRREKFTSLEIALGWLVQPSYLLQTTIQAHRSARGWIKFVLPRSSHR